MKPVQLTARERKLTTPRFIRTTDVAEIVWDPSSPFMVIMEQLEAIYSQLPPKYALTQLNLYALKDQHKLGAVVLLHLLYHAAMCDLTRVTLPGFHFPLAAAFRHAPAAFVSQCQQSCHFHAKSITDIIRQGMSHGSMPFQDPLVADTTFESTKIQIVFSTTLSSDPDLLLMAENNINSNLGLLDAFNMGEAGSSYHVRTLCWQKLMS